jgi:SET domain-containing protein
MESRTSLEARDAGAKGRGVFATAPIRAGELITPFTGWLLKTAELTDDLFALQVGGDLWLCSHGDQLDDCINHSCEPNTGFITGETVLYALRDITAGEEITFDYSTSISEAGWTLECACGARRCRKVVRPWGQMPESYRLAMEHAALGYLRGSS